MAKGDALYLGLHSAGLAVAVFYVAWWGRRLCSWAGRGDGRTRSRKALRAIGASLAAIAAAVRWRRPAAGDTDPYDQLAQRELQAIVVQRARAGWDLWRTSILVAIGYNVVDWATACCIPFNKNFMIFFISISPLLIALSVKPGILNPSTVDMMYCLISALQIVAQSMTRQAGVAVVVGRVQVLVSIVAACGCQRISFVFVVNVAMACVTAWVEVRLFPQHQGSQVGACVAAELLVALSVTAFARQFQEMTLRRLQTDIEKRAIREERLAMTRLLELMCDVVVELDANLHITQPAPKLAALLTLGTDQPMAGKSLQDFMPDDVDRSRFQSLATAALQDTSGALPNAMHTTMRGPNTMLQIELLYVTFQGVDGASCLVAGLRETVDQAVSDLSMSARASSGSLPPAPDDAAPGAKAGGRRRSSGRRQSGGSCRRSRRQDSPDPSACSATSSTSPSLAPVLVDESFAETSQDAKDLSLVHAWTTWNIPKPPRACCNFHAYVYSTERCLLALVQKPCFPSFGPLGNAQCGACGCVVEYPTELDAGDGDEVECDICLEKRVRPVAQGEARGPGRRQGVMRL